MVISTSIKLPKILASPSSKNSIKIPKIGVVEEPSIKLLLKNELNLDFSSDFGNGPLISIKGGDKSYEISSPPMKGQRKLRLGTVNLGDMDFEPKIRKKRGREWWLILSSQHRCKK